MKLLFIGDIHFRATSPRNRKDNYLDTLEEKLLECFEIAKRYKVGAIVQPGDIFHTPEVPITTLLRAVEIFKKCPVPFYCTPGNHDLFGYNIETYHRTSLRLLQLLSKINVAINAYPCYGLGTLIDFKPYVGGIDTDNQHYQTTKPLKTLVVHGMLLDHDLPYQAHYTNLHKLDTNADIILSGHDHTGFGAIKRQDGKLFVNPGALMRLTASEAEMRRTVQVAIIDTETRTAELVPLKSAQPAIEVLDRSKLEEKKERDYAISEFATLIKTGKGVFTQNLDEIVLNIGKEQNVDQNIIEKAVELLRGEFNNERN